MISVRPPVAAGILYDLDPAMLRKQIDAGFRHKLGPKNSKGVNSIVGIVPHSEYLKTNAISAWTFSRLDKSNFFVLGANERGVGSTFSIMKSGLFKTPLGDLAVDSIISEELMRTCEILEYDIIPHENENSVELQLPFIQHRFGNDVKIIPIIVKNDFIDENYMNSCKIVGRSIASLIRKTKEKWSLLAASNFSENPKPLLSFIKNVNAEDFLRCVNERNFQVTGYGAVATLLSAAKEMKLKKGTVLKVASSNEILPDLNRNEYYLSAVFH